MFVNGLASPCEVQVSGKDVRALLQDKQHSRSDWLHLFSRLSDVHTE